MKNKDLFEQIPEFLAGFDNIRKNGFFESIELNVGHKFMEGRVHGCTLTASGCVPKNRKSRARGCGAVIDPVAIIDSCRALAQQRKVLSVSVKIESQDWPLYDPKGENVIGSNGTRTNLFLYITFKTKNRLK